MITSLIGLLTIAVILLVLWWMLGVFMPGKPHQVIGILFGLLLLLMALKLFGVALP